MKPIIIYDSYTKNTEKIAKAIARGLSCKCIPVDKIENIKKYNLIIIGTPVHAWMPSKKIKKFLRKTKIKKYALFCTYGAPLFGWISANCCFNYILRKLKNKCIGKFKCPGFHKYLRTYKNRPNNKDLKNAEQFGKSLKLGSKNE